MNLSDIANDPELEQINRYLNVLNNRRSPAVLPPPPSSPHPSESKTALVSSSSSNSSSSNSSSSNSSSSNNNNNSCTTLRVRIDTVRVILRAAHPTFQDESSAHSPVVVIQLKETGLTGTLTTDNNNNGSVSTQQAFGINVHGFGTNFYPDGSFLFGQPRVGDMVSSSIFFVILLSWLG